MNLAVIGSRGFNNYNLLKESILTILGNYPDLTIVSGGAEGADKLAERFAKEYNLKTIILKPDWKKHGRSAGFVRNTDIWNNSTMGIGFWDGKSSGTAHSFKLAKKQNKQLIMINYITNTIVEE